MLDFKQLILPIKVVFVVVLLVVIECLFDTYAHDLHSLYGIQFQLLLLLLSLLFTPHYLCL